MIARIGRTISGGVLVALLAACSPGGLGGTTGTPVPMPTPTSSPSAVLTAPTATDEAIPADTAWLVTATTSKFTASARLCPGDGLMAVPMDPEYSGIFAEISGGPPDNWNPADRYEMSQGVRLELGAREYFYDLDPTGAVGDHWEVSRGKLTIVTDEAGRPRSGTGTGKLRLVSAAGDITYSTDTTTFTIEPADPAPWCFL